MRILFVNTLYEPDVGGGAERTLRQLVRAVREAGHEVAVATISDKAATDVVDEVPVHRVPFGNLYFHHRRTRPALPLRVAWHVRDRVNHRMAERLGKILDRVRPDIVSCHNLLGWSISAWQAIASRGIPIVQVLHDQYLLCAKSMMFSNGEVCQQRCGACRLLRRQHPAASRQVSGVIGCSDFIVQKLLGEGYFSEANIKRAIHNVRPPGTSGRAPAARDNSRITFGFIGTLDPAKGIEKLLSSFSECRAPDWRLLVAGSGKHHYEQRLTASVNDPRIEFVGYVAPSDFFPRVDVVVVPSLWNDTFPGVVIEAHLAGLPVIGTRRGGIPEMIAEGCDGVLFDPDEAGALTASLRMAAGQIDFWRANADTIRMRAETSNSIKAWVAQYIDVYAEVIEAPAPKAGSGY